MLFAAVTQLVDEPSLETLLTTEVEKCLICLVSTRRPTVSLTEQESILFRKILIRNKVQTNSSLEKRICKMEILQH
jgi:hypothetical protein